MTQPRFTTVDDVLWRGPRPQPSDYDYIKRTFKTVLSLEGMTEDIKEQRDLDPVRVLSFPILFPNIYIPWFALSQRDLRNILDAIKRAPKPLLVHCQHGQDRTGLIVAAYRVTQMGWKPEEAMAEAKQFGYRYIINVGLNRTWRAFKSGNSEQ